MHFFQFYHSHRLGDLSHSPFWMYELSVWLHTFSYSLVSIFIPILMLNTGYSITDVLLYYLLFNAVDVPLNFLARSFVRWVGAACGIAVATVALIGFFYFFLKTDSPTWLMLSTLAALAAIYDALYWVAHLYVFMNSDSSKKNTGRNTGILYALRQLALSLGPVIGAGILLIFGKHALFIAVISGLLLSILPLANIRGLRDLPFERTLSLRKFFAQRSGKRYFFSTVCYAVHDSAETVLFSLFIFLTFGTIQSVAIIPVIFSLTAMLVALVLGKIRPRTRELAIFAGACAIALVWFGRLFFTDTLFLYSSIFIVGMFAHFVLVPLDTNMFEYGRRVGDTLSMSMYRNIAFMATNVILYGLLVMFIDIFHLSFELALASLLLLALINVLSIAFARRLRTL